jgi:hypothetical protein
MNKYCVGEENFEAKVAVLASWRILTPVDSRHIRGDDDENN